MSFPRYEKSVESNIPWLGTIPAHWRVQPIKRQFTSMDYGISETLEPEGRIAVLRMGNIQDGSVVLTDLKYLDVVASELLLEFGDLLYNRTNSLEQVGKVGLFRGHETPVSFASYLVRMRTSAGNEPRFLAYCLNTEGVLGIARGSAFVAIGQCNLNPTRYGEIEIAVPPEAEQQVIANFLDEETAKIDALVAEQERLIELLKEKRQAVISNAVTNGLNPDAPMKDSGLAWLGRIPAHWRCGPLKHYWSVIDCKHVTPEFVDEGIPLASIREVQDRWVRLESAKRTTEHFFEVMIEGGRQPMAGDLIFSRNATVGEVSQVPPNPPKFALGQDVVLLRKASADTSSDYLQLVLRSHVVLAQLELLMIGATFKRINVEEIRGLVVPMPPPREQLAIAAALEAATRGLDVLVNEAHRTVVLLQERRETLISAAVTGQIDVRPESARTSA